jgi:elongation factor Ts
MGTQAAPGPSENARARESVSQEEIQMAEITAEMVRELRETTNVSMMECKRALVEAGGDRDKAIRLLRERGVAIAAKKAGRTANQGLIGTAILRNGQVGSLVEVNCETDFVARNETFRAFLKEAAEKACEADGSLADLLKDRVLAKVAEIGENIVIRRSIRYVLQGKGVVASYVHLGGKIGVLLEIGCDKDETAAHPRFRELAKDITLHIAACAPKSLDRAGVPADVIAVEREIYAKQVQNKPANIIEKIVDGKMNKFYQQVCLVEQGFVRDPETPVARVVEAIARELADRPVLRRFTRYQLGE